jgi:hypothetical protein
MIICTIAIVLLFFSFWSIIRAGKDKVTVKLIESNIEHPTYFIYALRGGMDWDRYLSTFTIPDKIQLIRQYVIENGIVGSPLNVTSNRCFLFSDGETLRFSDQGWIEFQTTLTSIHKYRKYRRGLCKSSEK